MVPSLINQTTWSKKIQAKLVGLMAVWIMFTIMVREMYQNTARLILKVDQSQVRTPLNYNKRVSDLPPCCPGGWIRFKQSHYVGAVIASLWEVSPHGYNIPRWNFLQPTKAPTQLWLGGRWEEFLTFQMEPMWPDSVGWFTFCQTWVWETQKTGSLSQNVKQ